MATRQDRHQILVELVDRATGKMSNLVKGIGATVGAYLSFRAASRVVSESMDFIGRAIDSATVQEDANRKLAVALASVSKEALAGYSKIVDLGTAMQLTTRHTDDQVQSVASLITQLSGLHGEALERATRATFDFADAMGIDAQSAAMAVAKAMAGSTAALQRYGIKLAENISPQERTNEILKQLEARFKGMSEQMGQTFAGRLERTKNAWGEFVEQLGRAVIESPVVNKAIEEIAKSIGDLTQSLDQGVLQERIKAVTLSLAQMARLALVSAGALSEAAGAPGKMKEAILQLRFLKGAVQESIAPVTGGMTLSEWWDEFAKTMSGSPNSVTSSIADTIVWLDSLTESLKATDAITPFEKTKREIKAMHSELDRLQSLQKAGAFVDTSFPESKKGLDRISELNRLIPAAEERLRKLETAGVKADSSLRDASEGSDALSKALKTLRESGEWIDVADDDMATFGAAAESAFAVMTRTTGAMLAFGQTIPEIAESTEGAADAFGNWAQNISQAGSDISENLQPNLEAIFALLDSESKSFIDLASAIAHGAAVTEESLEAAAVSGKEQLAALVLEHRQIQMNAVAYGAAANAAADLGGTVVAAAFGAKIAWGQFFKQLLQQFAQAIVQALILKAVSYGVFSGGGQVGPVTKLASGGQIAYAAGGGEMAAYRASSAVLRANAGMQVPGGRVKRDIIPAMLTPGEVVLRTPVVEEVENQIMGKSGGGVMFQVVNNFNNLVTRETVEAYNKKQNELAEHMGLEVVATRVIAA